VTISRAAAAVAAGLLTVLTAAAPAAAAQRDAVQHHASAAQGAGAVLGVAGADVVAQGAESVQSIDVQLVLAKNSQMHVTETIIYNFGDTLRHGIFRTIPREYTYDDTHHRLTPISDVSVSSPDAPSQFKVETGTTTVITIGDPKNDTVTGLKTYVVTYTVGGVVNAFSDHEELYWNVVGDSWDVPVQAAQATLEGPTSVTRALCYKGAAGSTEQCTAAGVGTGKTTFGAAGLEPKQGMTIVAAFPAGTFTNTAPILQEIWSAARAFSLTPVTATGSLAVLVLLGGGVIALVARKGRDEKYLGVTPGLEPGMGQDTRTSRVGVFHRDAVAVQFTPPEGLRPGQIGTLIDEQANVVDVTATLVDLAVRGLLRIEEVEKHGHFGKGDWRLVLARDPAEGELTSYETKLYNSIFEGRTEVLLSDLKQTFRADLTKVQHLLYRDVTDRGWFRGNPSTVRAVWTGLGVLALLAGVGLTALLAWKTHLALFGVAVALGGLLLLIFAGRMPARTAKGTAVLAQARGFRMYLETAEAGQIRWEEGEDVFSRYLPFAIVFGVAERWATVFAQLAASGAAVVTPMWYVPYGYAYGYGAMFDYGGFSRSMDSFITTSAGALSAATPSSSGSSGFGGGGFSGGGMGGGGGGSW